MKKITIDSCIKELLLNKENRDINVLIEDEIDFIITILRRYKKIEQLVNEGIISRIPRVAYIVMGCYDGKDD